MKTRHHRRQPTAYLWLETGAFFFFSVAISSLTIMGGLGINPFADDAPQVQQEQLAVKR